MLCSLLLHTIVGPRTGRKRGIDLSSSTACTQGVYFLTIFLTHDSAERNLPTVFNSSVSLPHAVNETGFESRADAWNDLFFFFPPPPPCIHASFPGLQIIFPQYLQEKFVQSALSYIMCNGEGEYICRNSQCGCQCAEEFPQCNCPITDIQIMEYTLANMAKTWTEAYKDLENSGNQAKHVLQLISFKQTILVENHFLLQYSVTVWIKNRWSRAPKYDLDSEGFLFLLYVCTCKTTYTAHNNMCKRYFPWKIFFF